MTRLFTEEMAKDFLKTKKYQNLKYIGRGAHNIVFRCENAAGDEIAVKLVSDTSINTMKREAEAIDKIKRLKNAKLKTKLYSDELAMALQANNKYRKHIANPRIKWAGQRTISEKDMNDIIDMYKKNNKDLNVDDLNTWKPEHKDGSGNYIADALIFEADLLGMDLNKFEDTSDNKRINFVLISKVAKGILKTLKILHDNNIAHLDVKSDNVFASNGVDVLPKFKLGDYGTVIDGNKKYNLDEFGAFFVKIIPGFPKDYKENVPSIKSLKALDMYCFGITILEFFARRYNEKISGNQYTGPFKIPRKSYTIQEFISAKNKFKRIIFKDKFSKKEKENMRKLGGLIENTTKMDPSKRWTVDQALTRSTFLKIS